MIKVIKMRGAHLANDAGKQTAPILPPTPLCPMIAGMSNTPSSTTLHLIRHGETDANVQGIWNGSTDSPLNARGLAQAQAIAQRLPHEAPSFAAIYSSPLQRATQTAAVIAEALNLHPVHAMPALAEFHLGAWEGLSYEELRYEKRLWERMKEDPYFAPPGGESAVQFALRLTGALQKLVATHPGQDVIVVSHGGALATALAMLLEHDGNNWRAYQMANCAYSRLVFTPQPQLQIFNASEHLQDTGMLGPWR